MARINLSVRGHIGALLAVGATAMVAFTAAFTLRNIPAAAATTRSVENTEHLSRGARPTSAPVFASRTLHARVKTLEAQLARNPDDASVLLEIANTYHDAHRASDAVPVYRRYLSLRGTDERAWLDLASSLAVIGNWTEAENATRRLIELNPANAAAFYNLGAIRANIGDLDAARSLWERIRDEHPQTEAARRAEDALKLLANPKS